MLTASPLRAPQPLVSVIIPIYNGEPYLAQALESVLAQTYSSLEIIAVDDGSTDASAHIAQAYSPRVRYTRQEFHSTAAARNFGVQLATGDYFAFLDQDDIWFADKLALQMHAFDAQPSLEAVFGEVEQFWNSPNDSAQENALPPTQGFTPSVMLITKKAFWRIGPFDANLKIGEWVDWFARAQDRKLELARLPQLVTRRRVHTANKGVRQSAARVEYARVLKASLDRRRAAGELS